MNLNNMSKEELIEELKKYLIECKNTITVGNKVFLKGEYYRFDNNEGGTWIENNGELFEVCDDKFGDKLNEGFFRG